MLGMSYTFPVGVKNCTEDVGCACLGEGRRKGWGWGRGWEGEGEIALKMSGVRVWVRMIT